MYLTRERLAELARKLDEARVKASGPGCDNYCEEPLPPRYEAKPGLQKYQSISTKDLAESEGTHYLVPSGILPGGAVIKDIDGVPHIEIPGGVHGRAFLVIDPETEVISCGRCEEAG